MNLPKCCTLRIQGDVQGVGFRVEARKAAERLGIAGFVRNEPDGSVFIAAEGSATSVEAFVAWCSRGPRGARVIRVQEEECPAGDFRTFEIR
ncbi:MAG: acylphosphatase [Candidatus Liptonbacteria bacterium]|nr:acylphosphatase [Candidatus Liptonbacteria bacterium]